jgi:hypothetical protein
MIRSNTALAILIVLILILFWFYLMHKIRIISRYSRPLAIFIIVSVAIAGGGIVSAVTPNPAPLNNITSLPSATSGDPTPANPPLLTAVAQPSNLTDFVDDQQALLKLGKALFWDMQLGSDGV